MLSATKNILFQYSNSVYGSIAILAYVLSANYPLLLPETSYNGINHESDHWKSIHIIATFIASEAVLLPLYIRLDNRPRVFNSPEICSRQNMVLFLYTLCGLSIAAFSTAWLFDDNIKVLGTHNEAGNISAKISIGIASWLSMAWFGNRLGKLYFMLRSSLQLDSFPAESAIDNNAPRITQLKIWAKEHHNSLLGFILVTGFVLATYYTGLQNSTGISLVVPEIASLSLLLPVTQLLDDAYKKDRHTASGTNTGRNCCKTAILISCINLIAGLVLATFSNYWIFTHISSGADSTATDQLIKSFVGLATFAWMLWASNRLGCLASLTANSNQDILSLTQSFLPREEDEGGNNLDQRKTLEAVV